MKSVKSRAEVQYQTIPIDTGRGLIHSPGKDFDRMKDYHRANGNKIQSDFLAAQTIDEVQFMVQHGWCDAQRMIRIEEANKKRKSLLSWLERHIRGQRYRTLFSEEFYDFVEDHDLPLADMEALQTLNEDHRQAVIDYMLFPRDINDSGEIQALFHTVVTTEGGME